MFFGVTRARRVVVRTRNGRGEPAHDFLWTGVIVSVPARVFIHDSC